MAALGRELPQSFQEALSLAAQLLSANSKLVERNLIGTEAEQIVLAAYRKATGKKLDRLELLTTRYKDRFPEAAGEPLIVMAGARAEGKLLQHLTGYQTFLENEYEVGPDVLIPRPETEVLVVHAIKQLIQMYGEPEFGLEIGVGSGAIAIEILAHFHRLRITASELTDAAAARARTNARRILRRDAVDYARLKVIMAQDALQIWEPFEKAELKRPGQFLISNPPYLIESEKEVESDVRGQEPSSALFGPTQDPEWFYREIARGAKRYLEPDAPVFVEIPHERSGSIAGIFHREGWRVEILPDLNGRDRVLSAK